MIRLLPSGAQIRVAALLGSASLKILKFKWFLCAPLALGIVAMKSILSWFALTRDQSKSRTYDTWMT